MYKSMYKRFYYFILSLYFCNSERKYNCSIYRYRRFYCKKPLFSYDMILLSSLYIILREFYFSATIDTITHVEYLDTVRRDNLVQFAVITWSQNYVN